MKLTTTLLLATMAFALASRDVDVAPVAPLLQLADMGMGDAGPQLGGSQDDMVLDDPGHEPPQADMQVDDPGFVPREAPMQLDDPGRLPADPNMIVTDPGHVPREADMNIEQPQDLDQQDDITE